MPLSSVNDAALISPIKRPTICGGYAPGYAPSLLFEGSPGLFLKAFPPSAGWFVRYQPLNVWIQEQ